MNFLNSGIVWESFTTSFARNVSGVDKHAEKGDDIQNQRSKVQQKHIPFQFGLVHASV